MLPVVAIATYLLNVYFLAAVTAFEADIPLSSSFREALTHDVRGEAAIHVSLIATGTLAAIVVRAYPWGVVLLVFPIVAFYLTLQHQARLRKEADRARDASDASLAEAQRLAHLGNWEWYAIEDRWKWSDETFRLLGLPPGAVAPTVERFLEAVHPDDRGRLEDALRAARRQQTPFAIEGRLRQSNGKTRFVHLRGDVRHHDDTYGLFGTIQDITERVQAEEATQRAKEAAEEANRAKTRLVTRASHELRTPLTAIQGFVELVLEGSAGELTEEQREYLGIAHRNSLHLAALVNDLLDLARIEAGQMSIRPQIVDVHGAADLVVRTFLPQAREKRIDLQAAITVRPLLVHADPDRLNQILLNLVGNAIKFTEEGCVTIYGSRYGERVEITVSDTGVGIPPETIPHLFDEFSQGSESARQRGGMGLGLAIVKQLVELQGGTIAVRSEPGVGSAFIVRLPAAPVAKVRRRTRAIP